MVYLGAAAPLGVSFAVAGFAAFYFSKKLGHLVVAQRAYFCLGCAFSACILISNPVKAVLCTGGVLVGIFLHRMTSSHYLPTASIGRPGEPLSEAVFTTQLHQIATNSRNLKTLHIHNNAALDLTQAHTQDITRILPDEIHLTAPLAQGALEALNREFPFRYRNLTFYYYISIFPGHIVLKKADFFAPGFQLNLRVNQINASYVQQLVVARMQHMPNEATYVVFERGYSPHEPDEVGIEILNALRPLAPREINFIGCRAPVELQQG